MSDQPEAMTPSPTRRGAAVRGTMAALAAAVCTALLLVAIVAPSPAIVVALAACALPTGALGTSGLLRVILVLRTGRRRRGPRAPIGPRARRALAEFRRELDAMPETTHPIGL
jgi:hypothetical protein